MPHYSNSPNILTSNLVTPGSDSNIIEIRKSMGDAKSLLQQTIDNQLHIRKVISFFNNFNKQTIYSHYARGEMQVSAMISQPTLDNSRGQGLNFDYNSNIFRPNTSGMHQRSRTMTNYKKQANANLFLKRRQIPGGQSSGREISTLDSIIVKSRHEFSQNGFRGHNKTQ